VPTLLLQLKWVRYAVYALKKTNLFALQALLEFLNIKPSSYREDMLYFLWDEFNVMVSEATVGRFLSKQRWSRKVVQAGRSFLLI
jgi:hypothetical protein